MNRAIAIKIAGKVRTLLAKNPEMSAEQIGSAVSNVFPKNELNFGVLREVDNIVCNGEGGGFWMGAFKYPKKGDIVRAKDWGGIIRVISVGYFTFEGKIVGQVEGAELPDLDWE